jgi:glycosyltransferase involved in cell wall biosynthesis
MKPPVSILICAYNAEKTIAETLQSVLAQTFRDIGQNQLSPGKENSSLSNVFA